MTEYMKEAERLLIEAMNSSFLWGQATVECDAAKALTEYEKGKRAGAALLVHIQRGAVPDGMPCEIVEADFSQGTVTVKMKCDRYEVRAGRHFLVPDHSGDATEMVAEPADDAVKLQPYGRHCQNGGDVCLASRNDGIVCSDDSCDIDAGVRIAPSPAEVPMPEPVGARFDGTKLLKEADVRTYGAACRAAGEAAGYTRGLKEAGRDAERLDSLENECNDLRTVSTGEDDYEWVVVSLHMAPPREREVGRGRNVRDAIDSALRGEVK